jgi:hypothetical protein
MARQGLHRTTPVRLQDLGRPSAVLSRPQWTLACAIDGAASAQDLAWRCGLSLYEAIENLGALIATGLCQPDPAETTPLPALPLPAPAVPETAPSQPAPLQPAPPQPTLPRRSQRPPVLSAPVMAAEIRLADGMPGAFDVGPTSQDLLRRVLEGLRRS